MNYLVLYNGMSDNKKGEDNAKAIAAAYPNDSFEYEDITKIDDIYTYVNNVSADKAPLICGGDGTLNHFVNEVKNRPIDRDIYFYPAGTGNDFSRDIIGADKHEIFKVNEYIKDLPVCEVNGKSYYFINGIGYGIDGYCCEVGDELRKKSDKPINYAGIAIKGLLFHFKPKNATVTVDGVTKSFKKVWLAPTLNGRFYGGGMMVSPDQKRTGEGRTLSTVLLYGSGKIHTLIIFPGIFEGKHVTHTKNVEVLKGHEMEVTFDQPCALQVDGETVLGVTNYKVKM